MDHPLDTVISVTFLLVPRYVLLSGWLPEPLASYRRCSSTLLTADRKRSLTSFQGQPWFKYDLLGDSRRWCSLPPFPVSFSYSLNPVLTANRCRGSGDGAVQ